MPTKRIPTKDLNVRASFTPDTLDDEARTVDVTFSTGARVLKRTWDGDYYEELSMQPEHIRWDRLRAGAPVLDNHSLYEGTRSQLGVVENADSDGLNGRASLRFSRRADVDPIYQDIKDGIVRNVSVGYRVHEYQDMNPGRKPGETPVLRAIDWEPFEISTAPIPADFKSQVRNAELPEYIEVKISTRNMEITNTQDGGAPAGQVATAPAVLPTPAGGAAGADDGTRADAVTLERRRAHEITSAVATALLEPSFAAGLIERGVTIDAARAEIIKEWGKRGGATTNGLNPTATRVGADEVDKKRNAMIDGLSLRTGFQFKEKGAAVPVAPGAHDFRGMNLLRLAEEYLIGVGVNTRGMSNAGIAKLALMGGPELQGRAGGYMSSSDFPVILGTTVNRVLRQAYEWAPRTFTSWAKQVDSRDFRPQLRPQLSGLMASFDQIEEGGEYKKTFLTETNEQYKLSKFGKIIPITWEAVINDDLSAFTRIPNAIAQKAAQKQSDIVYSILLNNPALLTDDIAVFDQNTHKNYLPQGAGTPISINSLSAGRAAMRQQKGPEGDYLNLAPSYLVVGPQNEQLANQYTSANYVSTQPSNINPEYNRQLTPIVEPRLVDLRWFLMAEPRMVDTVEFSFLEGEGELYTEQRVGFDIDGMEIKARMEFAAAPIDFRGMYQNFGQ